MMQWTCDSLGMVVTAERDHWTIILPYVCENQYPLLSIKMSSSAWNENVAATGEKLHRGLQRASGERVPPKRSNIEKQEM